MSDSAPQPRLLADRLIHWATERPDAVAITFAGDTRTWSEWHEVLRRLAGALGTRGIGRGKVVATYDKNNWACLDLTIAAGSIGAAHAIANWRLSAEEVAYVLNDCGAEIIFVGAELMPIFEKIRGELPACREVVVVGTCGEYPDDYEPMLAAATPAELSGAEQGDTALIMYTSGTTGFPKGAMLTHSGVNAHSEDIWSVFTTEPTDHMLIAMPLFHVGGTGPALMCVHAGTPLTLTREATPDHLLPALPAATHAFFVPAIYAALLQAGEVGAKSLAHMKMLSYGAAPMPLPILRGSLQTWPQAKYVQVYGMTELSGAVTSLSDEAHRDESRPERLSSAGQCLPGSEAMIVDPATLQPLPTGSAGELWIRGTTMMAGYLGKPEATADTITPEGWLRTGDVGHIDEDGFVFISDRVKDMIITGGENVYCPEVERVLSEHPDILECAVIGVPDDQWGETVLAFVAPKPGATIDPAAVIAYCRERLAHFKAPKIVEVTDALPRNGAGKILKTTLRKPYWEGRDRQVV